MIKNYLLPIICLLVLPATVNAQLLLGPIEDTPYIGGNNPGFMSVDAAGLQELVKNNLSATVAPTANEDSGDGYIVGSVWIDVTADKSYVLADATVAAAVWLSADVTKVGTPIDNQVAVWTGDGTLDGSANFTWDGELTVASNVYLDDGVTSSPQMRWVDGSDDYFSLSKPAGAGALYQIFGDDGQGLRLYLYDRDAVGSSGDNTFLLFGLENDNSQIYSGAAIEAEITDATDGSEDMELSFWTTVNGGGRTEKVRISNVGNVTVTAGDIINSQGAIATTPDATTLGAGTVPLAVDNCVVTVTGNAGATTVTTITGGVSGQLLTLIFVDGFVTITDTDAHTADTVDLAGAASDFTPADDTLLQLVYDGTSWYETSRSAN